MHHVWFVGIVLVFLLMMCMPIEGIRNLKMARNAYRSRHSSCVKMCEQSTDSSCTTHCISPKCNQQFYIEYELEEGELDTRDTLFQSCAIDEAKT